MKKFILLMLLSTSCTRMPTVEERFHKIKINDPILREVDAGINISNRNYYSDGTYQINVKRNARNVILYHEIGHLIDDYVGDTERFDEEVLKVVDELEKRDNLYVLAAEYYVKFIGKNPKNINNQGVQDIINAISRGRIKLEYSHTDEYWKREEKMCNEVFANLYQIYKMEMLYEIKFLKDRFPGIIKAFEELFYEL